MTRAAVGTVLLTLALVGCNGSDRIVGVGDPAPPENLEAYYYAGTVHVTWDLGAGWNQESFRIYGKRTSDQDYFLVADVTSCADGSCSYEDRNVLAGQTYEFYVTAVDPQSGAETATDYSVQVEVPQPVPPPVPTQVGVVALDHADYVHWSAASRDASDFSFYRVYLVGQDTDYLLGETDSEGFLDLLANNGLTFQYYVTAVDNQGHESAASTVAAGTPRPDYHGEYLYDFTDQQALSGFRFQGDESTNPIVDGTSADRHFRLEVDNAGWWLVPGPGTQIYPTGFATTALKCGVAADAGTCSDLSRAPTSGYTTQDVPVDAQTSYALRVVGDDGQTHYAVVRVDLLGYDQDNNALMIFDWAYQLQANNPDLAPGR